MLDLTVFPQKFQLVIGQIGIKPPEDIQRVIIQGIFQRWQIQPGQLAAQNPQIVGHIMPYEHRPLGKGAEILQDLFGVFALLPQKIIRKAMHLHRIADLAQGRQKAYKLFLDRPMLIQADARNLDDFITGRIHAGRLHIKHDDILCRQSRQQFRIRFTALAGIGIDKIRQANPRAADFLTGQFLDGRRTNARSKTVQHPHQTCHVMLVDCQFKYRQGVLYLLPPKELLLVNQHKGQTFLFRYKTAQ